MWSAKVWSPGRNPGKSSVGLRSLGSAGGATPLDPQISPSPPPSICSLFQLLFKKTSKVLHMENPDLDKPQFNGEDIENRTGPPDDVREVYRQVMDPLSTYLADKTRRFYFSLHWSGGTRIIRSDMQSEPVWGIVVLVDADEHELVRKAVEEWSKENGNPIPIRVG